MKSIIRYIFIIIGLLFLVSCDQETELEIPYSGDKMVVYSFLYTDQPVKVELSKSMPLDSSIMHYITDATIKLYENNIYIEDLIYNYYYVSPSNYMCKSGNKYSIQIYHKNFEMVKAVVTIPTPVSIKVVDTFSMNIFYTYRTIEETIFSSGLRSVLCTKIEINDPPGEKNYYILDIDKPQKEVEFPEPGTYSIPVSYDSKEKMIDGWTGNIKTPIFAPNILSAYFSDKLFNGKKYIFTVFVATLSNKINIKLYSISEGYYNYIKSVQEWKQNKDNPFAEPIIIYSNVINGMGILGGASCYVDSTVVIQ